MNFRFCIQDIKRDVKGELTTISTKRLKPAYLENLPSEPELSITTPNASSTLRKPSKRTFRFITNLNHQKEE